jgi:GH18 family chitinase
MGRNFSLHTSCCSTTHKFDGYVSFCSKHILPCLALSLNLTINWLAEISQGLDLLWRNNIAPKKVVLGLGFYGRSFTLSSPSCTEPGCAFSGGANPGECTQTSGILSNAEIQRNIKANSLTPVLDKESGVKYIVWDSNQW